LRSKTKSKNFQWLKLLPCCSLLSPLATYLISNQNVLIYTTHIKKVIAEFYFFILRRKITDKQ